ncbi:hypothetical protein SARC_11087 [Sphaeroforma arctica JP610]|uniref:PIPK domain-containing protein n=1 Tax=Sphaeroforma arctica JP610 TaxID=667725 RepID=A0A0L0FHZ2_9EUKA|nr:hypothetical protein SARC_11087 [Sphaeroforma arctica JP610]KNC76412.1 hypothetical protein SARC_11087 [Sphaeroforma arctica JP610]|eukprot:XP_014150314.1 hypothetical protein SARC_11087 [Sphaeroforma arctica JP610]
MNNILPTNLSMDEKFDLKGSTYKRQASQKEEQKKSPTLKDLNIRKTYNGGIYVEQRAYDAILRTLRRDCRVMQSFGIMDYSLLLGVHRLTEKSFRELGGNKKDSTKAGTVYSFASVMSVLCLTEDDYLAKDSDMSDSFNGGVLGFINNDQPVLLFLGVIDILQTYRIRKKLEHIVKASYADGKTISVCEPKFYASRFQDFLKMEVFTPISADVASGLLTGARQKWRLIPNKASPDVIDEAEGEHSLGQTSDGGSTEPLHGPAEHIDTARIHTRHVERDSTGFHHATPRSVSPGHRAKAVHADVGEVHRPTHTQGGMVREGERPAEIAALATVP